MEDPDKELVLVDLRVPRDLLDLLLEACIRRGMSLDQALAEGVTAAICGCSGRHRCVTLCDK